MPTVPAPRRAASLLTLSIVLAAALLAACKVRGFNSPGSNTRSTSLAAAEFANDPVLLKDDPAYPPTESPPSEYDEDFRVIKSAPSWYTYPEAYDGMLTTEGSVPGWTSRIPGAFASAGVLFFERPWDLLSYQKRKEKAGQVVLPLASGSVLEVLRRNRKAFARTVEGGRPNEPDLLGLRATIPSDVITKAEIRNPSKPFTQTECRGFAVGAYSDIKWHYYCQVPGLFRGCHRILIGEWFDDQMDAAVKGGLPKEGLLAKMVEVARLDHQHVISYCSSHATFPEGQVKAFLDEKLGAYRKAPAELLRQAFEIFYRSQFVETPKGRVNMFDYIMKSKTYAFDWVRQQAVLNAFYGELKADGDFDPSAECATYREPRTLTDGKNPCSVGEEKTLILHSNGR